MDIVTLGAALNGSAEYVNSHFKGGSNIQIVNNPDGTQTINASGEVSSEDTVARAEIADMKDGTTIDSFGDVETALATKANAATTYTKTEVDTALGNKADKSTTYTKTEVDTALDDKVDKETGKGLSTNDYTTAEKAKLAGIAEGAEVNVQSNWTQTTTTADDYIKNKPTLGTAASKNATDTYNATGTDVTTGKAVAEALATLPEPMVFKGSLGTGGTITTLPTASSSNKGYVYKVITAGTYASQSAKVGDTFISDGSAWVLIPSGDEPSGTVTNVAVANGGGLTVSGSPITTSGTITVGHSNSVTAKTSSSLKKFTYDANGHVTGSSELSTAESDALASGIDSEKVAQIEANKNNISLITPEFIDLVDSGAKNKIFVDKLNTTNAKGVTYTINSDGTITANGTPSGTSSSYVVVAMPDGSTYKDFSEYCNGDNVLSGCPSGGSTSTYRMYITGTGYTREDLGNGVELTDTSVSPLYLVIYIYNGYTANNLTFKPMICSKAAWDVSQKYVPYRPTYEETVEQVAENENNILTVADQTTKYNLLNQAAYTELRNVEYNNGVVTQVNTDMRSNLIMQLSLYDGSTFVTQLAQATVGTNGIISIPFTYNQEGNLIRIGHSGANIDARIVYAIPTDFVVGNKYYFVCTVNNCKQVIDDVTTPYSWQNMAIIPKAIYDSGFTDYQPYAMSNAELTTKEQANENNISISTIEISNCLTMAEGYTTDSLSKIYKQGNHIFGQLIISKSSGQFGGAQENIAAFKVGYRPKDIQIQQCTFSTSAYNTQNIGYSYIQFASAASNPGGLIVKGYAADIGSYVNIHIDFVI